MKETVFQVSVTVGGVTIDAFNSATTALAVATQAAVNVLPGASTALLGADATRKEVLISNPSATNPLYVAFGAAASATSGARVPPGGTLALSSNELRMWQGTINVFHAGAGAIDVNLVVLGT